MARIARIVVTHHQLQRDPTFPASWGTRLRTRFPATVVRVFDEDGRMGVGSGDAMVGFADYEHLFIGQEVGDQPDLMVDCHQGWRMPWDTAAPWDLERALHVSKELEKLNVFWMEEPLHRGDYEGMRTLRSRAGVCIAGAELTREPCEWRGLLEGDCWDVFQPDAVLSGGITRLAPCAREVAERGHLLKSPLQLDRQAWFTLPDTPDLGSELNEAVPNQTLSKNATFNQEGSGL